MVLRRGRSLPTHKACSCRANMKSLSKVTLGPWTQYWLVPASPAASLLSFHHRRHACQDACTLTRVSFSHTCFHQLFGKLSPRQGAAVDDPDVPDDEDLNLRLP